MEKYHFSKDQISYYVHNYEIDNHKQGRFTVINRKEFDRIIKERMETNSLEKEKSGEQNCRNSMLFQKVIFLLLK